MTSIKDIAQKAGVSISTVSRALNNYHDVNEQTREKIMKLASEMNYFANAMAKGLVQKRSYTIGLFFGDQVNSGFDHPFFLEVISAVREVASNAGYDLLIFTNSHKTTATYTTLCRERGVDGVFLILTGAGKKKNEQLIELQESGIPCVAIDLPLDGKRCSYVESNNFLGAKKAAQHLVGLGHRKIVFIGGDEIGKLSFDRLYGFRTAMSECGISHDPELIELGYFDTERTRNLTKAMMEADPDVTAFFAASDLMALAVIEALQETGYKVPQDVSVVGFDDIKEASQHHPYLTTVRQFKYQMGSEAIRLLMKIIDDESHQPYPVVIPCELMERETTAPARVT